MLASQFGFAMPRPGLAFCGMPLWIHFQIDLVSCYMLDVLHWLPSDRGSNICGARWPFVRVDTYRPKGRGFESHSSHHVGTLGSCLWRFSMKLRHSIRAVSGAPLSGLEEAL